MKKKKMMNGKKIKTSKTVETAQGKTEVKTTKTIKKMPRKLEIRKRKKDRRG